MTNKSDNSNSLVLSYEEITSIVKQVSEKSGEWHFDTVMYARAIEAAVVAKLQQSKTVTLPMHESAHNPYDGVQKYYEARKLVKYLQKIGFTVVISPELSYDV